MILADLTSVKNTITVLNRFTKCAGLKINIEKNRKLNVSVLKSRVTISHMAYREPNTFAHPCMNWVCY